MATSLLALAVGAAALVGVASPAEAALATGIAPGTVTSVAGGTTISSTGDGGQATAATLQNPNDLVVDAAGNLYIADLVAHRVRKVATNGVITTIAGTGTSGFSGDGGDAVAARLSSPAGVAVTSAGVVFVADSGNHRIRRIGTDGKISTFAGKAGSGATGDGGQATLAALNTPSGVALDTSGRLLIADSGNHKVRRVGLDGIVSTVAGAGGSGSGGDGGAATAAQLRAPLGIAAGPSGSFFVADSENHRIRFVDGTGTITTVAGSGTQGFSGDGALATAARLQFPSDVARDEAGNLLIADTSNRRIRKVVGGNILTVVGTGASGDAPDGVAATSADLGFVTSVTPDADGNAVLADVLGSGTAKHARVRVAVKTPPGAPVSVRATPANGSATVHWSAPLESTGTPLSGYRIDAVPGPVTKSVGAATLSTVVTGLTNGTSYTFTVTALYGSGPHATSLPSNAVVPSTIPSAPTNVTAVAGAESATLSWTVPNNGGSPITSYIVTPTPTEFIASAPGSASSFVVTNLVAGRSYTFTVTAVNAVGQGPSSVSSNPVVPTPPAGAPSAPLTVSAVAGERSATVSWSTPATDSGSAITGYVIRSEPPTSTVTATAPQRSKVFPGLEAGRTYTFVVRAVNSFGEGSSSAPSNPVVPTAPGGGGGGEAVKVVGYNLVASDGGIFVFGERLFKGSTGAITLNKPIVGMAMTPTGNGYWLVASDGGIFAFGDAAFFGSTGAIALNRPIVAMASTPTGKGYWLVASDGGIFAFGDARFFGSTGAITLNKPIVSMGVTKDGGGYWLVASDGGIFAFGNAKFLGSTGALALNQPIVAAGVTPTGNGYWLVASDGGIFAFGDATFFGSTGAITLNRPIVAFVPTNSGKGYWLVASDGGIFAFGDAKFFGSTGAITLNQPIVGAG